MKSSMKSNTMSMKLNTISMKLNTICRYFHYNIKKRNYLEKKLDMSVIILLLLCNRSLYSLGKHNKCCVTVSNHGEKAIFKFSLFFKHNFNLWISSNENRRCSLYTILNCKQCYTNVLIFDKVIRLNNCRQKCIASSTLLSKLTVLKFYFYHY